MLKRNFRMLVTIPAHFDHQNLFDYCLEKNYTYLGSHWKKTIKGEWRAFWEFECIETGYLMSNGNIVWFR